MIGFIKKLFGSKPAEQTAVAPYKTEAANQVVLTDPPTIVPGGEPIATIIVEGAGTVAVNQQPAKKPAPKKRYHAKKALATAKPATKAPATNNKPRAPKKPKAI